MEQRSPEWFAARRGKVTASRVADIMARTHCGYSASRRKYMMELLYERLSGYTTEHYVSSAMQWGMDYEEAARNAYSFEMEVDVVSAPFVTHPTIAEFGASPDGFVGDDGLIEIKCPQAVKHMNALLYAEIDPDYFTQMQAQLACTGRKWCDFISYHPLMPAGLKLWTKRIPRDEEFIKSMESEVVQFLSVIEATLRQISNTYLQEAA